MCEIVTEDHCKEILSTFGTNFILESHAVKPLQEESLGGLIGRHFILHINYKQNDKIRHLQLFVKTLNTDSSVMYGISENLFMFEKEQLFLMKLLPLYEERGIDVNFAPRGYLCEDKIVFVEDLTVSGFKLLPKDKYLDLDHCHYCLSTIAKFHVSSILYETCKSKSSGDRFTLLEEYGHLLEDLVFSGGDNDGSKHIRKSIEGLIAIAKIEFQDDAAVKIFENALMREDFFNGNVIPHTLCTVLHGDLWSNNFLHKYEGEKHVETKLIDYQLIKYGPPGLDVLQFIYSNTNREFRNDHFTDLLKYYYQILDELLNERAIDIANLLSKEEFLKTCEHLKGFAKLQSTIDRCLTCIPDEIFLTTLKSDDVFHDFLFENREKYFTDFYRNIPRYREIISEDLCELYEMMC